MEEIAVAELGVRGDGAVIAIDDIEDVDAVVFFWLAAAGKEAVGKVAHFWGLGKVVGGWCR